MSINWPFRLIQILAEKEAAAAGFSAIEPEHMIMGVTKFAGLPEPLLRLMASGAAEIQPLIEDQRKIRDAIIGMGKRPSELRRGLRADMGRGAAAAGEGRPLLSPAALKLIKDAWHHAQARGLQDPMGVDLLEAARRQPPTPLLKAHLKSIDENTEGPSPSGMEGSPPSEDPGPIDLARLTNRLKQLRGQLLETILGQDHAIHAFVEGIFNAEVTASADAKRKRPKGIFVFAGPPGVGKTFLAETGAEILGKPFLRLDMSGYGDAMGVVQLVGAQRSYRGAKPGKLTQFVQDNPHAMLLFDEIEKASLDVIHLFLQILDNGSLEDKFTEANVNFRDTLIIFTTNAGRMLYADGAATGAVLHRRTILSALEQEMDPRTHKPFFPQAICSRMATGYPVMFNRLGVGELVQIAEKEMQRVGALFEQAHGKRFDIDPAVPLCLVLREGARTDARTVRSQAEIFCKNAFFNLLRHMSTDHLQTVLDNAKLVRFCVENPHDGQFDKALADVMQPPGRAKLLLAARSQVLAAAAGIDGIEIAFANDMDAAKTLIATDEFDLALVDPWIESLEPAHVPSGTDMDAYLGLTVAGFDKAPIGARLLRRGIELLRCLNESPESPPAFMLNLVAPTASSVDDELLMSAARYGVRGAIDLTCKIDGLSFEDGVRFDADDIAAFEQRLHQRVLRIRRERGVAGIVGQGKALAFDTVPAVVANGAEMLIRLRGLRVVNSPAADDVGGLISDAERPAMGFDDVFGADQAKLELRHIVDWLKNPRRFAGLGLTPPRGVLLYGPPGTGKTMLARALAGESQVAFLVESATNFVTKYVGSGPESVRNLFARGRRYAPSIVFIDEIDAVGRKREGTGFNRAQEETLNAILTEMDGFSTPAAKPVIVIAATNLVDALDPALVRRFDREVEVDRPDKAARTAFLSKRLAPAAKCRISDAVIGRIARQSAGDTIANLERAIRLAGRRAAQADGVITDAIIEDAFETLRMGDAKGRATDPAVLLRIARHEAGHCLVGWLQGDKPMQITIVARGRAGGYVEREALEDKMIYTKRELEQSIRQAMGGRAAEMVYYGEVDGLSSGVRGDLQQATRVAEGMVRHDGMAAKPGQVALGDDALRDGSLALVVVREKERIIAQQLEKARLMIESHRETMDELVRQLMEKNRLTREELERILPA